ncbi:TetR family transcriptional regulator [Geodermatophilus sp. DSM 44513]|uniref:TetR/AcrR family transcriptional regulator n=1 Tax=Geodermatophilus sp. DSM 44513 TaxID=1528104 RepID=UPI0014133BFC|nr:TetR family transcriptional regulator [Geodermatophilus sp. DSM 44513]WNV73955.1 TetR family transcriptional regulator [Geodermatophilus sp. DSM 44513]
MPRSDALRNRRRLLEAARDLVARSGPGVGLEAVAARAGVGIGTLYRHFPDRAALLAALVADRLADTADRLAATAGDEDPAWALRATVREFARVQVADAALAHVVRSAPAGPDAGAARAAIGARLDEVCRRARDAGVLRPGIDGADLHRLVCGLATAAEAAGTGAAAAVDRYVDVLLDGLAPAGR